MEKTESAYVAKAVHFDGTGTNWLYTEPTPEGWGRPEDYMWLDGEWPFMLVAEDNGDVVCIRNGQEISRESIIKYRIPWHWRLLRWINSIFGTEI